MTTEAGRNQRRVLVTGGASGIGRAICLRLAREGVEVVINYRTRSEEAQALVQEITRLGGRAHPACGDVVDPAAVQRLVGEWAAQGGLQGVVHAASAPLGEARFTRTEWTGFQHHLDVTLRGAFNLMQAFAGQPEACRPESAVLLLSSVTMGIPPVEKSAYTSAKYALLGLARSLAVELASRRIRVNCVSPGFAETPLTERVDPRVKEMIARAVPLKRLATVEEIASAVTFLLHPENSYVTGVNLPVAGGAVI